eukprot:scaffold31862_cov63-Phaeocystis_antarctica.AAC.2
MAIVSVAIVSIAVTRSKASPGRPKVAGSRRLWAGTGAPLQPRLGSQAARALLPGAAGRPEQARRRRTSRRRRGGRPSRRAPPPSPAKGRRDTSRAARTARHVRACGRAVGCGADVALLVAAAPWEGTHAGAAREADVRVLPRGEAGLEEEVQRDIVEREDQHE